MLLDDLSDYLTSGGITTPIYLGFLPETPDDALLLSETGGFEPVRGMSANPGQALEVRPTVQVLRRSPSYQRAEVDLLNVFKLLDGMCDRTINGTRYKWIAAMQDPSPLGRDTADRRLRVCNFMVCKAMSTSTST